MLLTRMMEAAAPWRARPRILTPARGLDFRGHPRIGNIRQQPAAWPLTKVVAQTPSHVVAHPRSSHFSARAPSPTLWLTFSPSLWRVCNPPPPMAGPVTR